MPFRLPGVARIREYFATRRRLKQTDRIIRDMKADPNVDHTPGVYTTQKYKQGSTGDLRYHLDRSLKPALMAEFRLSEVKAAELITILNTNRKISTAFYGVVNLKGKQREQAKTDFYAEVNRLLVKYVVDVTPRIRAATTMIVEHHDH